MENIFIISGGGTGAKVVEAFIHLCATGAGPEKATILLVDADATNGNVARTRATYERYRTLHQLYWRVNNKQFGIEAEPFRTRIELFSLIEEIQDQGSLKAMVELGREDPRLKGVVNLFFNDFEPNGHANQDRSAQAESEQYYDCTRGFLARPNLGAVQLGRHLNEALARVDAAYAPYQFLTQLKDAIEKAPADGLPVIVVGSVFGGTGASLLPVARGAIEHALQNTLKMNPQNFQSRMRWGKVMLLPYFASSESAGSVDPDRFKLDASRALYYYNLMYEAKSGQGQSQDVVYLLGLQNSEANKVKRETGQHQQKNPTFLTEWLGALAIYDFLGASKLSLTERVRILNRDHFTLEDMPARVRDSLGRLLQLATFYLTPPAGGEANHKDGLRHWIFNVRPEDLAVERWWAEHVDPWATAVYGGSSGARNKVSAIRTGLGQKRPHGHAEAFDGAVREYFTRLLHWVRPTLVTEPNVVVDYAAQKDYNHIFNQMADTPKEEVAFPGDPNEDNALAIILRVALAAIIQADQKRAGIFGIFGKTMGDTFKIEVDDKIKLRTLASELANHNAGRKDDYHGLLIP